MIEKSRRETSGFFSFGPVLYLLPGGAALAGPGVYKLTGGLRRPGQAQPPPGTKAAPRPLPLPGNMLATETTAGRFPLPLGEGQGEGKHCWEVFYVICGFSGHCAPGKSSALCLSWRRERTGGGQSPPPPVPPGSGQQNRRCAVPSTYPCRLRVGPRQRPCKTRPSARIHAGCPGLPGTSQRF